MAAGGDVTWTVTAPCIACVLSWPVSFYFLLCVDLYQLLPGLPSQTQGGNCGVCSECVGQLWSCWNIYTQGSARLQPHYLDVLFPLSSTVILTKMSVWIFKLRFEVFIFPHVIGPRSTGCKSTTNHHPFHSHSWHWCEVFLLKCCDVYFWEGQ